MLAVVLLSVIWLSVPQVARAGVEEIVANMLSWLAYWLITLMANLLVVVVNILVAVAQYNNFLGAPAVERGWVIVRDIANMFFIVVLLIIAFGTILRLENYRYNRLLARLIVMAILVNFSKFIAGFFIDFGQIIMLTFVNAWRDVAAGNITHALGLTEIVQLRNQDLPTGLELNSGAILTALLLGLFLVTVAVIVLGIMAIVLILRVLALWFLIVLSPLAYLFRTYPSTEKYAARWWQEFGRYVIVGPVMAFLLWLSLAVMAAPVQFSEDVFVKVRTTEGAGVIEPTEGGPANNITAAISTIGQSDKLLGYMTSIMLLVGTLMITKELGVAGGQMAGQWADKIRGFATKAATVGGATAAGGVLAGAAVAGGRRTIALAKGTAKLPLRGAKGVGGAVRNWFEKTTGIITSPKEIGEQIKAAGQRRRGEAIVRRDAVALRRIRGYQKEVVDKKTGERRIENVRARPFMGTLGAWEWGWYNKKYLLGGKGGRYNAAVTDLSGTAGRLEGSKRKLEQREKAKDAGKYYTEKTAGDRVRQRLDERAVKIAAERAANPYATDHDFVMNEDGTRGAKYSDVLADRMAQEEKRQGRSLKTDERTEIEKRFEDKWNVGKADDKMRREERRRQVGERVKKIQADQNTAGVDSQYYVKTEQDKEGKPKPVSFKTRVSEILEKNKVDLSPDDLSNLFHGRKTSKAMPKGVVDELTKERLKWNEDLAEQELSGVVEYEDPERALQEQAAKEVEKDERKKFTRPDGTIDEDAYKQTMHEKGVKVLEEEAQDAEAEAKMKRGGLLSRDQVDQRKINLKNVEQELAQIDADLKQGKKVGLDETTLREMERRLKGKEAEQKLLSEEISSGKRSRTKEEEKEDEETAKSEDRRARQLRDDLKLVQRPTSETELNVLREQIKGLEREKTKKEAEVTRLRPEVPVELRASMRNAINEKKKNLTSDSWQEHASVMENAVHQKDLSLAAAALYRAAEYGNENELMNHFGYDYSPEEFKAFIDDIFVKQMKMSEDQALAIATDISFIAEKNRHWNIARTTSVDAATGQYKWQPYENQQTETLAEVRKLDFEDFVRRGNRLAWGNEIVGMKAGLPNSASLDRPLTEAERQKKAAYFRTGGSREFQMNTMSQTFLAENYAKTMRNLTQGRFNVNLAVKLTSPENRPMLEELAQRLAGRVTRAEGKDHTFGQWQRSVGDFAARGLEKGEFDLLRDLLEERARRRR